MKPSKWVWKGLKIFITSPPVSHNCTLSLLELPRTFYDEFVLRVLLFVLKNSHETDGYMKV